MKIWLNSQNAIQNKLFCKKNLQNYFQLLEKIINDSLFDMLYGHLEDLWR